MSPSVTIAGPAPSTLPDPLKRRAVKPISFYSRFPNRSCTEEKPPMADDAKVFIVMTHGPGEPQRCATPFYMANVAAVMENAAKVVFQIDGVLLMRKGVAESLSAFEGGKPIIEFIREAKDAGVEFYCCSAALERYDMTEADLIDECDGVVGAAWMLNESLDSDLVLSY
jgi:uncharacterized protein